MGTLYPQVLTLAGKVTNQLVASFSVRMAEYSEAKLRIKISRFLIFDVKYRFALLASKQSNQQVVYFNFVKNG
jgi:hypothetical protein